MTMEAEWLRLAWIALVSILAVVVVLALAFVVLVAVIAAWCGSEIEYTKKVMQDQDEGDQWKNG